MGASIRWLLKFVFDITSLVFDSFLAAWYVPGAACTLFALGELGLADILHFIHIAVCTFSLLILFLFPTHNLYFIKHERTFNRKLFKKPVLHIVVLPLLLLAH